MTLNLFLFKGNFLDAPIRSAPEEIWHICFSNPSDHRYRSVVQRISNRKLSVNGLPAIQHKFKAAVEGVDVIFWTTYVEGKNHFYQVQAWTLASMEAQNEKGLLKVADSFKEN